MEKYDLKKGEVKFHNIVLAYTGGLYYEESRYLLLERLDDLKLDEYVIVEGYHCSCYEFDDTKWEAIKYSRKELLKIIDDRLNEKFYFPSEREFYKLAKDYFYKNDEEEYE